MKIFLHKNFVKKYLKLRENEKAKFKNRRNLFSEDQFNPILNNHSLKGKYTGCRSFNVAGDLRVIYDVVDKDSVLFIDIDNHNNLYK